MDGPSMRLWYIKCEMFLCYKNKVKIIKVAEIVVIIWWCSLLELLMPTVDDIYNPAVHLVLDVNTVCYEITVGIIGTIMIFLPGGSLFCKGAARKFACILTYNPFKIIFTVF
jgi:hypothetical protein